MIIIFGLRLAWYSRKELIRVWLLSKLLKKKDLHEEVYDDILRTFYIDNNTTYRLYMKDAPIGDISLQDLLYEEGLIQWKINDIELKVYHTFITNMVGLRLSKYPKIKPIHYTEGNNYILEVHHKNYKQEIK